MTISNLWENENNKFIKLDKKEFDALCKTKEFEEGPLLAESSSWMNEFGPYNPHKNAFGKLKDGRLVYIDIDIE